MSEVPIAELRNVSKIYPMGESAVPVFNGVSLEFAEGEFAAILGPSGSGKSTLLALLGCLDQPTSGEVRIRGRKVSDLSDAELAAARNRDIGFVFQNFQLLPQYDAVSNVELPLLYAHAADSRKRAEGMLELVGLQDRMHHFPGQLSGGQRQRVAIARALVNRPALLLADEPTGNLDSKSGQDILALFRQLRQAGSTTVIVTHDPQVAASARRIIRLSDGVIASGRRSLLSGDLA